MERLAEQKFPDDVLDVLLASVGVHLNIGVSLEPQMYAFLLAVLEHRSKNEALKTRDAHLEMPACRSQTTCC